MFQGNWKCSKCGGSITELPFEPRSEAGLTCRDCYVNQKNGGSQSAPDESNGSSVATEAPSMPDNVKLAGEQPPAPDSVTGTTGAGERPKIEGEWNCASCGGSITSLPFQPRSTENLKCIDCFKKSKN